MEGLVEFLFVDDDCPMGEMGMDLAEVIVTSKLASTKTEARRHIKGGAIRLNNQAVTDPFARLMLDAEGVFLVVQKRQPIDIIEEK